MELQIEKRAMETVHELASREFGRMAQPLEQEGLVQTIFLPEGSYATVVLPGSPEALVVRQAIGAADFSNPGLGEFLLREHNAWLFGRISLDGETLAVEQALLVTDLSSESLARGVLSVHMAACKTEQVLRSACVLSSSKAE